MEFKPIETAPRDQTVIDLWTKRGVRYPSAIYLQDLDRWHIDGQFSMPDSAFSYWTELPELPEELKK